MTLLIHVVLWFLIWICYDLFHEEKTYRNDCVLIVPNPIIFHDCPISDWLFGFLGLVPCLHDLLHSDEQSCSSCKEEQQFSGILSLNLSIFWLKIFLILMVHHSAKWKLRYSEGINKLKIQYEWFICNKTLFSSYALILL